jgi:hypothetical protein
VKAYEAESSIGWIKGLGYYIASKYMWDIKSNGEAIKKNSSTCVWKSCNTYEATLGGYGKLFFATIKDNDWAMVKLYHTGRTIGILRSHSKRFYQIKSYLYFLFLYHEYQMINQRVI